jgi:hypothetical protein
VAPWLVGGFNTGGPLFLSCLAPMAALPRSREERSCIAGALEEVNPLMPEM